MKTHSTIRISGAAVWNKNHLNNDKNHDCGKLGKYGIFQLVYRFLVRNPFVRLKINNFHSFDYIPPLTVHQHGGRT